MRKRPKPGESALTIRSFSSHGNSSRLGSRKSKDLHHVFSNVELAALIEAESRSDVHEIRAQVALNISIYNAIAAEICAPQYPIGFTPTSDLVLTLNRPRPPFLEVICCKTRETIDDPKVMLKVETERRYWVETYQAKFRTFTECDIPQPLVQNVLFLRPYRRQGCWLPCESEQRKQDLLARLRELLIAEPSRTLRHLCERHDRMHNLVQGTSMGGVRYALAQEIWTANLNFAVDPALPPTWLVIT